MPNTYTSLLIHCIFGTKRRENLIPSELHERIWSYLGGIAKNHDVIPLSIGVTDDHVHMLLVFPPVLSLSNIMQQVKAKS
jgi:REP element-mobilizing transposase RayT